MGLGVLLERGEGVTIVPQEKMRHCPPSASVPSDSLAFYPSISFLPSSWHALRSPTSSLASRVLAG